MDETVMHYLRQCEAIDQGPFEVTKGEADFLERMREQQPAKLSVKQMDIIDRLTRKYLEGREC